MRLQAPLLAGLFAVLGLSCLRAQAQAPGDWPPHGQGPGGPPPYSRDHGPDGAGPSDGATRSTMRGGLQLGPPGRWWDDQDFANTLRLRPDQQTHMDAIFAQNKSTLLAHYDTLRDEERQLESLTRGANIDEHTLFAHIDRVSQARAELEKANAHMLLLLRHELTPDQVNTLDEHRPSHFR